MQRTSPEDRGAIVPLGSDWMVADFDPRVGLAGARLRRLPGAPERVPYLPDVPVRLTIVDGDVVHRAEC